MPLVRADVHEHLRHRRAELSAAIHAGLVAIHDDGDWFAPSEEA